MEQFTIVAADQPTTQDPSKSSLPTLTVLREPTPAEQRHAYVADLQDQVRELVASEPKDFARATILIYDIFRLRDERESAREMADLFDLPAIVLFQVPSLVRSIHLMDPTSASAIRIAAMEQIADLTRLVIMALDGEADAAIVCRLVDLSEAIATAHEDPDRLENVTAAADRLTHLVNAFFFDRLTVRPALRDYIVQLELGL